MEGKQAETLMSLGYKTPKADADVLMKRYFKTNVYPYYKYMLCYVDYLPHIGFKPKKDMDVLNMTYWLNEGFGPPEESLGANVEKVQLKDG